MQQPDSDRKRTIPRPSIKKPRNQCPNQTEPGAGAHDDSHMIGFPYVDEDFARIPNVIHGHRIKARFKLLKKEKFDEEDKEPKKPKDAIERPEERVIPPRISPPLRHYQHPNQQRQS